MNNDEHVAHNGYLTGQLLIAMPMISDDRFEKAVIYICAHSEDGAMGIVINNQSPDIDFEQLLQQLSITSNIFKNDIAIHIGGPVETERGFVLHSSDYSSSSETMEINEGISLTATIDILKAIATGDGPEQSLIALGYAGWGPGQLEQEIQHNGWLHCEAALDIVFDKNTDTKYKKSLKKLGINPSHFVTVPGRA